MEENRLDEKEQCLRDAFERITGDDLSGLHSQLVSEKNSNTNGGPLDNASSPEICRSVIEETVESEGDELYVTVDDVSTAIAEDHNGQTIIPLNQGSSSVRLILIALRLGEHCSG